MLRFLEGLRNVACILAGLVRVVFGPVVWTLAIANDLTNRLPPKVLYFVNRVGSFFATGAIVFLVSALALLVVSDHLKAFDQIRKEHGYSWGTYGKIVLSSAIAPNPAKPLSATQKNLAYGYARVAEEEREFFESIVSCESGARTGFKNTANENGTTDMGYLQINSVWSELYENRRYREGEAYAIVINLEQANEVYGRQGKRAWACYKPQYPLPPAIPDWKRRPDPIAELIVSTGGS